VAIWPAHHRKTHPNVVQWKKSGWSKRLKNAIFAPTAMKHFTAATDQLRGKAANVPRIA
jgi:hypothetical protein